MVRAMNRLRPKAMTANWEFTYGAARVEGIDVILTGHTHNAMPRPLRVKDTLLVATGSHGKFVSRLDLAVEGGRVADFSDKLMPVLAAAIAPPRRR